MSWPDLEKKYFLDESDLAAALRWLKEDNTLELEKLLVSRIPVEKEVALEPLPEFVEEKPTHGYRAAPRKNFLFVKPLPKEHKGRIIIPPAYESTSDMGFVHDVGPDVTDIKPGDLVLFDKYAEVGQKFNLVDEDGELVDLIQMSDFNVTAILTRIDL
jgi:co-chaperonin GroES (HSP10)